MELFSEFHDTLYAGYSESLSGSTHILIKMHHMGILSVIFSNPHKVAKNIRKSKASAITRDSQRSYKSGVIFF
jgi:hypothetical protein